MEPPNVAPLSMTRVSSPAVGRGDRRGHAAATAADDEEVDSWSSTSFCGAGHRPCRLLRRQEGEQTALPSAVFCSIIAQCPQLGNTCSSARGSTASA